MTEFPGLTRALLFMFSYISLDSFYFKASCHNLMFHSLHCWNTREFWHQSMWNICLNKCSIRACQLWPVAFSYSSCWMYLEARHSAGSEVNFGIFLIKLWLQNLYLIMYVRKKCLFYQSWDSLPGCGTKSWLWGLSLHLGREGHCKGLSEMQVKLKHWSLRPP